ncbi:hypothetical protein, partial [Dokdonella immobilis]|uniref:hypothetical protein n=1 Tax=Dokdonella immobilis TaxID=578942 RepID=UPI001C3175A0
FESSGPCLPVKLLSINAKHSVRNLLVRHHAQSNTEEFVQPSPANLMNETVTVPEKSPTGTSAMSTRGCLGHSGSKLITARGKSSLNHDAEYMSEHRSSSSRWLDLEEASIYVPIFARSLRPILASRFLRSLRWQILGVSIFGILGVSIFAAIFADLCSGPLY